MGAALRDDISTNPFPRALSDRREWARAGTNHS
jgi:hypothetical protein